MTARQIAKRVQDEADARFGDTIGRLLLLLRQRHAHQCWRKECFCDYCQFINGQYVDEIMRLHAMKKRLRYYEYTSLTMDETDVMMKLDTDVAVQKWRIKDFKKLKKEMQKDIL